MIVCPSCDAENADDANHCGNCGARLHTGGGQKTMFGFAAVSPEQMMEAAKEVAANKEAAAQGPAKPKLPTPGLPTPSAGIPAPNSSGSALPTPSAPGKFNIPKPGGVTASPDAKTEMTPAITPTTLPETQAPLAAPENAFGQPVSSGGLNEATQPEPTTNASGWPSGSENSDSWGDANLNAASGEASGGWSDSTPSTAGEPSGDWGTRDTSPPGTAAPTPVENAAWGSTDTASAAPQSSDGWGAPAAAPVAPMATTGGGGGGGFGGGGGGGGGPLVPTGGYARGEVRDPIKTTIFILLSCGLYALIWTLQIIPEVNKALGEERFSLGKILLLSFVTCGFYGLYFQWQFCEAVVELQKKWGVAPVIDQPILFFTNFFYVGPYFIQSSLNNAWENGNPPG